MPIGAIGCGRREVKPFTEAQIALVKTFADQAVIAIENTRLFEEVQARTRELQQSLEYQTATSELLKVIGQSTFDLQRVFDALAENAVRLCDAERSLIYRLDAGKLRAVASSQYHGRGDGVHRAEPACPSRERVPRAVPRWSAVRYISRMCWSIRSTRMA